MPKYYGVLLDPHGIPVKRRVEAKSLEIRLDNGVVLKIHPSINGIIVGTNQARLVMVAKPTGGVNQMEIFAMRLDGNKLVEVE